MNKTLRKYLYQWASLLHGHSEAVPDTTTEIDVVIPVIEKDLDILPLCLEGVKHCVPHPIRETYIVAPSSDRIEAFCQEHGTTFVEESSVLGYGPRSIDYSVNGTNRAGWIFQQLLKLSGRIGTAPYFLVIDADHILVRRHTFLDNCGRTVFYMSKEFHPPYYRSIESLLGMPYGETLSYVDHKMLFFRASGCTLCSSIWNSASTCRGTKPFYSIWMPMKYRVSRNTKPTAPIFLPAASTSCPGATRT